MSTPELAEKPGSSPAAELDVSVVIPCLNEAENIEECVLAAKKALADGGLTGEVVVADNGSTDGSGEIAARAGARVIDEPRRGYGSAYLAGFDAAKGRVIVMGDADLTYDFGEIPRFVKTLDDENAELVMGNRMESIHPGAMPWLHRYIGNPLLSGFLNLLYRSGIRDAHCGMRAIRRDALPRMALRSTGMEFASEMVIRAVKEDLNIAELDIEYHPRGGESKLSSFRDGWRHLRLLLVHSPTALFIIPGAIMLIAGAIATVLVAAEVSFFGRQWDLHALIAASLSVLLGAQVMSLGAYARAYGFYHLRERPDGLFDWGRRNLSLERGIALGGAVLLAGLIIAGIIVGTWIDRGFGELSEEKLAVVAVLLMILGAQTIFSSFFLSLIGLAKDRDRE